MKKAWRVNTEGVKQVGGELTKVTAYMFAVMAAACGGAWLTWAAWLGDAGLDFDGLDVTPVEHRQLDPRKAEVIGPLKMAVQDGNLRHVFDFEAGTVTTEYRISGARPFDSMDSRNGKTLLDELLQQGCASGQMAQAVCPVPQP